MALVVALGQGADAAATGPTTWSYVLPEAATTSAGVYTDRGILVRTLWRGETRSAGANQGSWDGQDDRDRPMPDGRYEIRVLAHHVRYVWEGVIGNSSESFDYTLAHKALGPPTGLVLLGDELIYAVGFNEGQPGLHGFRVESPQRDTHPFASTNPFAAYSMVAADDERLYWANTGGFSHTTFVSAFDRKTRQVAPFPQGEAACLVYRAGSTQCYDEQNLRGLLDLHTEAADQPTGIAVQTNGRLLAVAHGALGVVRLYDKATGALVRELRTDLAKTGLNQLAMTKSGQLWVSTGRELLRYGDLETAPRIVARAQGFERILALAATRDDGVWVADGGTRSQVVHLDRAGRPLATLGALGGYRDDARVSDGRLCFRSLDRGESTALVESADGGLWVVDTCNNRMLHYRAENGRPGAVADAQVAYLPKVYLATVDHGRPRRVFANFLEFDVDDEPLQPGRSWRLVRNWLGGLPATLNDEGSFNSGFGGLQSVETLANGRTYAIVVQPHGGQALVELPETGPMRFIRKFAPPLPGATARVLYENGELGYALTGRETQSVVRLALQGFDDLGDPQWSEPFVVAKVPLAAGTPFYRGAFSGMPPRFPITGSGAVVFFDQSVVGNEGFHLGAARPGTDGWTWQASPSGPIDGKGTFQTKAVDQSLHYGGNAVWTSGGDIVFGYHGEFYKDLGNGKVGQANQFMHFQEDGLFVGQFGVPTTRLPATVGAGLSGNALSPTLVRAGSRLFLVHNDEWAHGGVHRWRIDGTDTMRTLRGSGDLGGQIELR